ncbi:MAG: hypothetical protein RJB01_1192 [Actinomycetota bacterium]
MNTYRYYNTHLNEHTRARNLTALAHTTPQNALDVLVIGGGVTGAGSALDAATRGLRVGLIEGGDYATGASSASSRLAHGGLRYLEQGHISLVHEALRERRLLVTTIAPHLTRRLDFLFPVATHPRLAYAQTGVALYDLLATAGGGSLEGRVRGYLNRSELTEQAPGLRADGMAGAVRFSDAQIDDARHTVAVVRTAQGFGALVANYATCEDIIEDPSGLWRVRVQPRGCDGEVDGSEIFIWARSIILAVGAWTNLWAEAFAHAPLVRPSRGTHILIPRDRIALNDAVISRTEKSVLFILPWEDSWIIGTTDDDFSGDPASVTPTEADITYLIEQANYVLEEPISREDVIAAYAGLRPLPAEDAEKSTSVSREHVITQLAPGVFAIVGGKYTTYRVMAADAVDDVAAYLMGKRAPRSVTEKIPLVGAEPLAQVSRTALTSERWQHLQRRYGTEAAAVESLAAGVADPWAIAHSSPEIGQVWNIEIAHAQQSEGARCSGDLVRRRLAPLAENSVAQL